MTFLAHAASRRSPRSRTARPRRRIRQAAGIVAVLTVPGCAVAAPAARHAPHAPATRTARAGTRAAAAGDASGRTASGTPSPPPRPSSRPRPRVILTRFRAQDGTVVTVARFAGPVRYRLHDGSQDPGPLAAVRAGPAVVGAERRRLLAAFNGGFKLSAGAGGYEQEGHVLSPLRAGLASLVIDRSGAAYIGVWGSGLPRPGEAVLSVRQNLPPLVRGGHATPAAADWTQWGATLGGGEYVARSAVGQNRAGNLIFAAAMSATPADLAAALVHAGARTAMQLDINPEWVQLDVASRPGRPLRPGIPGQVRPADQYLVGWTRDFITVLGR